MAGSADSALPAVAFLADGRLYLKSGEGAARLIESPFAQEALDQAARTREKHAWKTRSEVGRIMAGRSLWGEGSDPAARCIRISAVTGGAAPGELLYALETESVGGLFRYDSAGDAELRLFHRNQFRARHLSLEPGGERVAFSAPAEDGSANIAVIGADGRGLEVLTEGDSLDEAPSWVPGGGGRLVYQSAGLARSDTGHLVGVAPYAVHLLDPARGEIETLAEDPRSDFLLPRMTAAGMLYTIRRPYQPARARGILLVVMDVLLFPLRLFRAIVGFLNVFSLSFSGKPLITAGGPRREGPEPGGMLLWGRMVEGERAARKGAPAPLVPKEWRLVRRAPDGTEEVLADSVVSYDLCAGGGVVYTDGSTIYHLDAGGGRERICEGKRIEHVLAEAAGVATG